MPLRDYQENALAEISREWRQGAKAVLLVLPTGGGKTAIGSEAIRRAVARGRTALFLAHRRELISQASKRLTGEGIHHGIVMAGEPTTAAPVQIASIDTLKARDTRPPANLVIWDESHHVSSEGWSALQSEYPEAWHLGLTATPCRADGKGLGDIFGAMVVGATVAQLTAAGFLVPCDIEAPAQKLSKKIAQDPVEAYLARCAGEKALVYAGTVKEAHSLAERFLRAGVNAAAIDGTTKAELRDEVLRRFASGEIRVLCNMAVLTEGFDCLDEETEILTEKGWRGRGEIHEGELVYALNRDTELMELVPVESYVERPVASPERMVTLRSQHVNIRTTEGHEFHIKYRDPAKKGALSDGFITKTGAELVARKSAYALPLSAPFASGFSGAPLSDDEIRFIGWVLTDGCLEKDGAITISQSKHFKEEIRAMLQRLGFSFTERTRTPKTGYANAKPATEFRIPKGNQAGKQARNGWVRLAPYLVKKMTPLFHQMTREQFLVLWGEMLKGNGTPREGKSGWLWTRYREQVDTLTWMATVRGFACSYSTSVTKNNVTMYALSVRDTRWITSSPSDSRAAKIKFENPASGETVWCVKNKLSTLVTRRQGKIAIIGNCPDAEVCIVARAVGHVGLWLQIVGRVLRPSPGKSRALVLDLAGSVHQHGLPEEPRTYSLGGEGIVTAKSVSIVVCQMCGAARRGYPCARCGYMPPEVKLTVTGEPLVLVAGKFKPNDEKTAVDALVRLAVDKNRKAGWVNYAFKERYGYDISRSRYVAARALYDSLREGNPERDPAGAR